ncbi:hypothetical protein RDI58_001260 [Solanum bulbocastanum]|uniref:Uncharacterized protein n=1 Tax=Solanum bulbocastanum TaxID=147425 RepID=A0AAN8YQ09_SOLBU
MASVSIGITSLVGISVWKLEFYIVNSINGGIDVYGAMACACWTVNFSAEDNKNTDVSASFTTGLDTSRTSGGGTKLAPIGLV